MLITALGNDPNRYVKYFHHFTDEHIDIQRNLETDVSLNMHRSTASLTLLVPIAVLLKHNCVLSLKGKFLAEYQY